MDARGRSMEEKKSQNGGKADLEFMELWDFYSPLLTEKQKRMTDLYFNFDLSLAEIAEEYGVSRQSVSDCLKKSQKQLEEYEKKLGFIKALHKLQQENALLKKELAGK